MEEPPMRLSVSVRWTWAIAIGALKAMNDEMRSHQLYTRADVLSRARSLHAFELRRAQRTSDTD